MRVPSSFLKGSGSLALVGKEARSGRVGTAQLAPSSSTATGGGAAASAVVVFASTATAPATASVAATVSTTTVGRILERPELMITRALLPVGGGEATPQSMITDVNVCPRVEDR